MKSVSVCASGSAVEHLLAKEGVAGSIPVSRFFYFCEDMKQAVKFHLEEQKHVNKSSQFHGSVRLGIAEKTADAVE